MEVRMRNKHSFILDNFTTEQLNSLLRMYLANDDAESIEAIQKVAKILEARARVTAADEMDARTERAWEEFQTYYNVPAEVGSKNTKTTDIGQPNHNKKRKRKFNEFCCAAIIAFVVLMLLPIIPTAAGYDSAFTIIGRWTKKYFFA